MAFNKTSSQILDQLLNHNDLDEGTSKTLMKRWLNDEISEVQTGAFLAALRAKKVTGTELFSMANELLKVCKLPLKRPDIHMVDTCGTGGDGANTFNISTAVSFVASSMNVNISKHGNKSASGKVGSADVLLNLGLNLNAPLEKVISAIEDIGITFLFAPVWHKSLIKLSPLRKSLGVRTVFNQLGPLVNPLRPNAQILGVASEYMLEPMAFALNKLGMDRAIVIHGYGGLDEASLEGENKVIFLDNGKLSYSTIDVANYNCENSSNLNLVVSEYSNNEEILESVLKGKANKSQIEVVALNTALVLWAAGNEDDISIGFNKAMNTMSKAKPWDKFLDLRDYLGS